MHSIVVKFLNASQERALGDALSTPFGVQQMLLDIWAHAATHLHRTRYVIDYRSKEMVGGCLQIIEDGLWRERRICIRVCFTRNPRHAKSVELNKSFNMGITEPKKAGYYDVRNWLRGHQFVTKVKVADIITSTGRKSTIRNRDIKGNIVFFSRIRRHKCSFWINGTRHLFAAYRR